MDQCIGRVNALGHVLHFAMNLAFVLLHVSFDWGSSRTTARLPRLMESLVTDAHRRVCIARRCASLYGHLNRNCLEKAYMNSWSPGGVYLLYSNGFALFSLLFVGLLSLLLLTVARGGMGNGLG